MIPDKTAFIDWSAVKPDSEWHSKLAEICGMSNALYAMMEWPTEPEFKVYTAKRMAKQITDKVCELLPCLKEE